ncbi:LEAF RUST 10 DISEASE-RESISTANCE LOCUS RECEPTOR-LIKE PROTEIN [Drosera capensis]
MQSGTTRGAVALAAKLSAGENGRGCDRDDMFNVTEGVNSQSFQYSGQNLYNSCIPKSCGNENISYPFYIVNQQDPSCGYPGFKLMCLNKTPVISISGDNFIIQDIFYQNQSIRISAFLDSNCSSIDNLHRFMLTDPSEFVLAHRYSTVTLLVNSDAKVDKDCQGVHNFTCERNGNGEEVKWAYNGQLAGLAKCRNGSGSLISLPYEGGMSDDVVSVLKRGFILNWTADNCTACENSGGRCGWDDSMFLCYCHDRVHANRCEIAGTHHVNLKLILATAIPCGALLFLAVAVVVFLLCIKPRSGSSPETDLEGHSLGLIVPLFSYSELEDATNKFEPSRAIGDGGYGTVYHGKIKDGRDVAIKRLYEKNYRRVEQFMNEVEILTRLRHQNLVTLYGCTSHRSRELLLVYEYIPNGTVADHLYGDRAKPGLLPWLSRLSIAVETASALSYLHASGIIHRDVKSYNILLDNNFSVKVADFGLSRLLPSDLTHISTAPQGTPGYLDPEYHHCYQLTEKSDVYSFGVVLVELISSLPAVDMERHRHEINLADYAMSRIQRCAFSELVDPHLGYDLDYKVRRMTSLVAELAFQCLQPEKEFRPSMNEVLEALKRIESTDYGALEAEELNENNQVLNNAETIASPEESDEVVLLKNVHHPPSPDTVINDWVSRSTTPNIST